MTRKKEETIRWTPLMHWWLWIACWAASEEVGPLHGGQAEWEVGWHSLTTCGLGSSSSYPPGDGLVGGSSALVKLYVLFPSSHLKPSVILMVPP